MIFNPAFSFFPVNFNFLPKGFVKAEILMKTNNAIFCTIFFFTITMILSGCNPEKEPVDEVPFEVEHLPVENQVSSPPKLTNPDSVIQAIGFIKQEIETNLASNEVYSFKRADSARIMIFKDGGEVVKISQFRHNEISNIYYHEGNPVLVVGDFESSINQQNDYEEKWFYLYYDSLINIEVDEADADIYRVASLSSRREVSVNQQERKRIGQMYGQQGRRLFDEFKNQVNFDGRYQFMINQEIFGEYVQDTSFYLKNGIKFNLLNIPMFSDWELFINGLLPQFPCYLQLQTKKNPDDKFRVYPLELVINNDQFSIYLEHDQTGKIMLYGSFTSRKTRGGVFTGKIKFEGQDAETISLFVREF